MPSPSVVMGVATLTRYRWTFSQSSKYPLCPPETGGRAKRRGSDKNENGKVKGENGKLRVNESRSMVGTRHAVSEKPSGSRFNEPKVDVKSSQNGKQKTEH